MVRVKYLILLLLTFNVYAENILNDDFYNYCLQFAEKHSAFEFESTADFYEYAWNNYLHEILKKESEYEFEKGKPVTCYYKSDKGKWLKLYINEYTFVDSLYNDDYRRYKKGFKIYGMYYFFNSVEYEELFNRQNENNTFCCLVFHVNALGRPEPLAFNFFVKMIINELGNIQLEFYESKDFFDVKGKYIFSVVVIRS